MARRLTVVQDPARRAQYDAEGQRGEPVVSCEVDLDDLRVTVATAPGGSCYQFEHDCRCGDVIRFTDAELQAAGGQAGCLMLACPSCSLHARVLYAAAPAQGSKARAL